MYDKKIREEFWTKFGQFMALHPAASGERVSWLNYKTGVRHIHVRIAVEADHVYFGIEVSAPDLTNRDILYRQLLSDIHLLVACGGPGWKYNQQHTSGGRTVSALYQEISGVNVFIKSDWPAIISFLKRLLLCFDQFWTDHRDLYAMIQR
jgi:hypothetical protein